MAGNKAHREDIITTFGERLEDLRRERGMTQVELADLLGISKSTVQNYETDNYKDLSFSMIKSIADLFDVSIDYLAGLKVNRERQDTPVEALMLTDEAVSALKQNNFDHLLLSDLIAHKGFQRLMLDIAVYVSQSASLSMVQNNSTLSYAREMLRLAAGDTESFESRTLDLAVVDEDRFVREAIHDDMDMILADLQEKHKPDNIEELKEQTREAVLQQMAQAYNAGTSTEAPTGSPEQFLDILLEQIQVPADKLNDEQRSALLSAIKLSPLLKSKISQRGKK